MTLRTVQVLSRAADLIDRGWCAGVVARTAKGKPVSPFNRDAAQFCLVAAVRRVVADELGMPGPELPPEVDAEARRLRAAAVRAIAREVHCDIDSIAAWQDARGRTKADVMLALRGAVEREALHERAFV